MFQSFWLNRVTGFASAKVGRLVAFTVGGAIILLEVANEQGIIKIDWSRLYRKADEAGDKVQQAITGEGPKWMEKVNLKARISISISTAFHLHSDEKRLLSVIWITYDTPNITSWSKLYLFHSVSYPNRDDNIRMSYFMLPGTFELFVKCNQVEWNHWFEHLQNLLWIGIQS